MGTLIFLARIAALAIAAAAIATCGHSKGEAWFGSPLSTDLGVVPVEVSFGDFNRDNRRDLLVRSSDGVLILLGNGDGTFRPPTPVVSKGTPRFVASGDLDADGVLDLIVIDCPSTDCANSVTLSTLMGSGDGTFRPAVVSTPGSDVAGMGVGHLNGDGCADVVIGRFDRSVSAFLGNCDGGFREPIVWGVGTSLAGFTARLKIADMNVDGKPDVIAAWHSVWGWGGIDVLLGAGDGNPGALIQAIGGIDIGDLVITDFNIDGIPDLVSSASTFRGSFPTRIWLGQGDGGISAGQNLPCPAPPGCSWQVGDFDGDLRVDVMVIPFYDVQALPGSEIWIALFTGDETFAEPLNTGLVRRADETPITESVDVNGDGKSDLVFLLPNGISIRLNMR